MATPNQVTATIVVQFADGSDNGVLTAELDSRPDGYNGGKSTFTSGDEPVILVRKGANVNIIQTLASAGVLTPYASGTTDEEDTLNFVLNKSQSVSKPISSLTSAVWYGASLGPVQVSGAQDIVLTTPGPNTGVGVLKVKYQSAFTAYKLQSVPSQLNGEKNFSIVAAFIGQVVG